MLFRCCAVTLALGSVASPLAAQDGSETAGNRTPANAQRFLAVTPPQAFFGVSDKTDPFIQEGEVSSPDACTTVVAGPAGRALLAGYTPYKYVSGQIRSVPIGHISISLSGSIVTQASKGTPGYNAGLRAGDQIVSVDGQPFTSIADWNVAMSKRLAAKSAAEITYTHDGVTKTATVVPVQADNGTVEIPVETSVRESLTINWGKVEKVFSSAHHNMLFYVNITIPSDTASPNKWLSYSVAETRDRALAAAQYLQQACDKTKELGF